MDHQPWIMHLDMDAFYASVEQLDNPELRGRPVAVGGSSDRSVVSAASYEIRKYGVRSAMSVVKARKLCPQAIFVPVRMSRYKEVSGRVMDVLHEFSPLVEQASVDEAYLDITGTERLFGQPEEIGRAVKGRVKESTGLNCSVGIAPVRFLAKIASDLEKPDGLTVIRPHQVKTFMARLPVGKIPGVGAKTLEALRAFGVENAADMLRYPETFWSSHLGKAGPSLYAKAQGLDPAGVTVRSEVKSCSAENTFDRDTSDRYVLEKWLLAQSERVGADLRRKGLMGRTVTLKVKFSDFRQITRSRTLDSPVSDTSTIHATAVELLSGVKLVRKVRLIGVGLSNFGPGEKQLSLLGGVEAGGSGKLDKAVDLVRNRFGAEAVRRGGLMEQRNGKK